MIGDFHFLRPEWLLGLVPALVLSAAMWRSAFAQRGWARSMDPELRAALTIEDREGAGRLRPRAVVALAWMVACLALAGPAWTRVPAPFAEDEAAVMFVLKVTPEMMAGDVQPSRLQRAVQKMTDLQALRAGGRSGLVAYAGSAHRVMPLTSDSSIIQLFAADLDPSVMPVPGDDLPQAIRLAQKELDRRDLPGSIIVFADYVSPEQFGALEEHRDSDGAGVHFLAMAAGPEVQPPPGSPPAPPLDRQNMSAAARAAGGSVSWLTPDDEDVRSILSQSERSVRRGAASEASAWRDDGWVLIFPLLVLVGLSFRRGGGLSMGTA